MHSCTCGGFVPRNTDCPNCRRPWRERFLSAAILTLSGGALSMTLMACYGLPPCENLIDRDGDGYSICNGTGRVVNADCDDADRKRHPGAKDTVGDGIDQNCDGVDGIWQPPPPPRPQPKKAPKLGKDSSPSSTQ